MTTWFTADLHLGHKNIIKYCTRPWTADARGVEAMNEALVENWNRVVAPEDTVWNLGDFAFCCSPAYAHSVLWRLNGRHHLLRGNHDGWLETSTNRLESGERVIMCYEGYVEIEVEGQSIVLCHYPMRSWHHCQRGVWHLYGHVHHLLPPFGKSVDVGVDATWEVLSQSAPGRPLNDEERRRLYRPMSFAELKAYMDTRPIGPHE